MPASETIEGSIGISTEEKHHLVQRVIESQMFRRAAAMRAFLLYITNHEILGQTDKLKEHTIGVEVLGRKPDFLDSNDNIVRVRAHELRGRLERYFALEGANEPVVLTLPAGSYAPKFVPRKMAEAGALKIPNVAKAELPAKSHGRLVIRTWVLLPVIALAALTATIMTIKFALKNDRRPAAPQPTTAIQDFWTQFFEKPNNELNVVYADPGFAFSQDLRGKRFNLGDYLNDKYLSASNDRMYLAAIRPMASSADIETVAHLGILAGQLGGQVNLEFARDASVKFFEHGNVILLGSRRSNPWVELYESSLNFTLDQDPDSGAPRFRNRLPRHDEMPTYSIPPSSFAGEKLNHSTSRSIEKPDGYEEDERNYVRYGVAALLKGCGSRGLTVLAEGLNTQGTHAVGEMLTDPQRLEVLLKSIGHKTGTRVKPFEALIQFTSFPNSFDNPKVIAFRIPPPGSCVGN